MIEFLFFALQSIIAANLYRLKQGGEPGIGVEKPGKKPKKMIRMAGGQMWEDASLFNWDPNDFRDTGLLQTV